MKPSISIDLPGWCSLRRGGDETSAEPLVDLLGATSSSSRALSDAERTDSERALSTRLGDSDDEGDDDENGAIARLFSLGGRKKRMSSSMYEDPSYGPGLVTDGVFNAERGRGRIGSATSRLQAEAYGDWACVRCTLINAYNLEACQGCRATNVKRHRLLREIRQEVERRGKLQVAREDRKRCLKEDALKDLLEDSDSDGECVAGDSSVSARDKAPAHEDHRLDPKRMCRPSSATPSGIAQDASACVSASNPTGSTAEEKYVEPQCGGACFANILPPDLLLHCAEFLGDRISLCRVREVSHGWLLSLDDQEAGCRLWRPLFYRLRASGSIHAATDARGQRRRTLKVYDLGTAAPADGRGGCGSSASGCCVEMSTPGGARIRISPATGHGKSTGYEKVKTESSSGSAALSRSAESTPRRSCTCLVCGLIQRDGYGGQDCEMCASSLMLQPVSEPSSGPRVAYTRVELSGNSASTGQHAASQSSPLDTSGLCRKMSATSSPSLDPCRKSFVVCSGRGGSRSSDENSKEIDVEEAEVDWHFLVKRLAEEKRVAAGWGSLHQGWVWLQGALQAMLHRRIGDEWPAEGQTGASSNSAGKEQQGSGARSTETQGYVASAKAGALDQSKSTSLGSLKPMIAKAVRMLSTKKWVLLYDGLKSMFTLQAEGMARKIAFAASTAAVADEAERKGDAGQSGRKFSELEGLRRCVQAWEAYKDWCEEVDMICELLNEQISAERYRTAGSGCGRGDHTPFIRETALLSFRHSFALNIQICAMLRDAIAMGVRSLGNARLGGDRAKVVSTPSQAASKSRSKPDLTGQSDDASEDIFTDLELMEDSRAIDFSVRSIAVPCRGYVAAVRGRTDGKRCASSSDGGAGTLTTSLASRSRGGRSGHYYDWFVNRLEGKEEGIIRGDIDARGKRVAQQRPAGAGDSAGNIASNSRSEGGDHTLGSASIDELLDLVRDMIEELDVSDDSLSKERHTQGAMRRLLFLPIKRWQAALAESTAEDPQSFMLMAGLSPSPGREGFHRLREGAAGRRRGMPPKSALGKDAGKSWEQLRTFFG